MYGSEACGSVIINEHSGKETGGFCEVDLSD
jgi:hypothetical protein